MADKTRQENRGQENGLSQFAGSALTGGTLSMEKTLAPTSA